VPEVVSHGGCKLGLRHFQRASVRLVPSRETDDEHAIGFFTDADSSDESGPKQPWGCIQRSQPRSICLTVVALSVTAMTVLYVLVGGPHQIATYLLNAVYVDFDSIEMGNIGGTFDLHPRYVGHVGAFSLPMLWLSASVSMRSVSLRGSGGGGEVRIGSLSVPEVQVLAFRASRLSGDAILHVENLNNLAVVAEEFILKKGISWKVRGIVDMECKLFNVLRTSEWLFLLSLSSASPSRATASASQRCQESTWLLVPTQLSSSFNMPVQATTRRPSNSFSLLMSRLSGGQ